MAAKAPGVLVERNARHPLDGSQVLVIRYARACGDEFNACKKMINERLNRKIEAAKSTLVLVSDGESLVVQFVQAAPPASAAAASVPCAEAASCTKRKSMGTGICQQPLVIQTRWV